MTNGSEKGANMLFGDLIARPQGAMKLNVHTVAPADQQRGGGVIKEQMNQTLSHLWADAGH